MRRDSDTLRPGDRAPEFTLQDAYGMRYSLQDLLSGGRTKVPAYDSEVPAYENGVPACESEVPAGERIGTRGSRLLLVFDRGTW